MEITVLGPGCARCENTEKLIMEVAAEMGVAVALELVKDPMKIAEHPRGRYRRRDNVERQGSVKVRDKRVAQQSVGGFL
jgi:hypothetical protein